MTGEINRAPRARRRWDEKADAARELLVEEAMVRLLEEQIAAMAALVTPSALARRSGAMSVDTAYRLLGGPADVLRAVAQRSVDPTFSSERLGWRTTTDLSEEAVASFHGDASGDGLDAAAAMRALLVASFSDPAYPIARMLQAAVITASPVWTGAVSVSEEHRALAEEIREAQRSAWEQVREYMRWMVQDTLAALRRRPVGGLSLDKVLLLLHTLAEGALDRLTLYPELLTPEDVVDAIVALMLALTEEGSMADPRLPDDPEAMAVYSRLIAGCDAAWSSDDDPGDLHAVAERFAVPFEAVVLLFPTMEHLADSVLRARVTSVGVEGGAPATASALLRSALWRLAQTASAAPALVERARALAGSESVLQELRVHAAGLGATDAIDDGTADRVAEQAVATACSGVDHWPTTEVLLDLLLDQPRRGSER
ncbi:MAG: hypothetical protein ACKO2C_05575 [Actinomycetes bacterium]